MQEQVLVLDPAALALAEVREGSIVFPEAVASLAPGRVLVSYSPSGERRWTFDSSDPDAWVDSITDLALDAAGNLYLAGSMEIENGRDFALAMLPPR